MRDGKDLDVIALDLHSFARSEITKMKDRHYVWMWQIGLYFAGEEAIDLYDEGINKGTFIALTSLFPCILAAIDWAGT